MKLDLLPERVGGAAENMAADFLLLQRYPNAAVRLRHYGWLRPAFTFGYSQKLAQVRQQLGTILGGGDSAPLNEIMLAEALAEVELCRRATGGGLVDHRNDWTYALVIPRGHELEAHPAAQSYQRVHAALAAALRQQGVPAELKMPAAQNCITTTHETGMPSPAQDACTPSAKAAQQALRQAPQQVQSKGRAERLPCFQQAECFDVIRSDTGEKIAGAAQKRTKHGLLFQGSVSRAAAERPFVSASHCKDADAGDCGVNHRALDWAQLYEDFAAALAEVLAIEVEPCGWPDFAEAELEGLIEQYSAPEWLALR